MTSAQAHPVQPSAPGWHVDPFGRFNQRWWDGSRWTEKVRTDEEYSLDPPGIDTIPAMYPTDESAPVEPITDAHLPLRPPSPWGQITFGLGLVVLASLVVLIILYFSGVLT